MNDTFQRLMADATNLTRSGDLRAATAAIQAALSGAITPTQTMLGDTAVIEGEAHEVRDDDSESPRSASGTGQFVSGSYSDKNGSRDYKLFIPPRGSDKPLHEKAYVMVSYHFLTPVDENTTRYFWLQNRNTDPGNAEISAPSYH